VNPVWRRVRPVVLVVIALGSVMACARGFQPRDFANPEALFRGAVQEFQQRKWSNAVAGFERLTLDLSSRDSLLVPTYYYLAQAHEKREEFLLAAQAYQRLSDGFPADTLAPKAILGEGRSYQQLWRKPVLDAEYGLKALGTLRVLLTAYPDGPEAVDATQRIAAIEDWLARKDYEVGMHYLRTRKAYDPAIIYFQDVIETYPNTPTARKARLAMVQSYRKLKYAEEARETCDDLHRRHPGDAEVLEVCGPPVMAPPDSTPVAPPSVPPPR